MNLVCSGVAPLPSVRLYFILGFFPLPPPTDRAYEWPNLWSTKCNQDWMTEYDIPRLSETPSGTIKGNHRPATLLERNSQWPFHKRPRERHKPLENLLLHHDDRSYDFYKLGFVRSSDIDCEVRSDRRVLGGSRISLPVPTQGAHCSQQSGCILAGSRLQPRGPGDLSGCHCCHEERHSHDGSQPC